ncbi:MAG: ribonuclease HII [Tepidiphilus sp.]|nr:ribonuclease HII [Tepidiphilus sp.]MDD3432856.1 ribonuclease HII [Tepidiphilus sp.]
MSRLICGVDEAGRGPLAGPVVAAAVILPPGASLSGLNDSKKLSPRRRERLAAEIRTTALAWAVAEASAAEIDEWNILRATLRAMARAVAALPVTPDEVRVDGNQAPALAVPVRTIIGGDALEPAIMAASILAKTHRDARLVALDARYPEYGFARHKGYGTAAHLAALARLGPCPEHRRSFAPVRAALERMGR